MRGRIFLICLISALLTTWSHGCTRDKYPPESGVCAIRTELDETNNYVTVRIERNQIDKGLDLNLWLHQQGDVKDLQLVVIYKGLDALFVKLDETLTLHVDKGKMELTGGGGLEPRSALSRWWIMEMASYDITNEQLRRIAYAREVIFTTKNREYTFSAANFECFRKFYKEYIAGKAGPEADPN